MCKLHLEYMLFRVLFKDASLPWYCNIASIVKTISEQYITKTHAMKQSVVRWATILQYAWSSWEKPTDMFNR
jgi:hypothetical protein